jgi:hypothetical protein
VPWTLFTGSARVFGLLHQLQMIFLDLCDLGIDAGPAFLELGTSRAGIQFGTVDNLLEQTKDRLWARRCADKRVLTKSVQPFERLLC